MTSRQQSTIAGFFAVLDLSENSTPDDIRRAYVSQNPCQSGPNTQFSYRRLALQNHPDKVSPEHREEAAEKFKRISEAYQVLMDDGLRREYEEQQQSARQRRPEPTRPDRGGPFSSQFFVDPFSLFERVFAEMNNQMHHPGGHVPAMSMFHQDPFFAQANWMPHMTMMPHMMPPFMMHQSEISNSFPGGHGMRLHSSTSTSTSSVHNSNMLVTGRSTFTESRNGRTVHVERETLPNGQTREVRQEFVEDRNRPRGNNQSVMIDGETDNNSLGRLIKRQVFVNGVEQMDASFVDNSMISNSTSGGNEDTSVPVRIIRRQ